MARRKAGGSRKAGGRGKVQQPPAPAKASLDAESVALLRQAYAGVVPLRAPVRAPLALRRAPRVGASQRARAAEAETASAAIASLNRGALNDATMNQATMNQATMNQATMNRGAATDGPSTGSAAREAQLTLQVQDGWVEGQKSGQSRRKLQRELAAFVPRETQVLDLHGLRRGEAQQALRSFLAEAHRRAFPQVLVIVGKGHGSEGGKSVLREAMLEVLEEPGAVAMLRAVRTAPRHLGGSGAVVLFLVRGRRA